jgi:PleD family two-component response regulator
LAYVQEAMGWLPGRDRLKGEVTPAGETPQGTGEMEKVEQKPVILVVDDNADMREYLTSLLGWRFEDC